MSSLCIYFSVDRVERALRAGSFLREWKVGDVKGVNATQREVRKGKLAIHEVLGRGEDPLFGGGAFWSREQINTSHRQKGQPNCLLHVYTLCSNSVDFTFIIWITSSKQNILNFLDNVEDVFCAHNP